MKRKKITPKERVLKRFPKAIAKQWATQAGVAYWNIEQDIRFDRPPLATAKSAAVAWRLAYMRIRL